MRITTVLFVAALAAFSTAQANDVLTGIGGAIGGAGGAAGAVVGGAITDDSKPKTVSAPPPLRTTIGPTYYDNSNCNRNNPGKGKAKGYCKH